MKKLLTAAAIVAAAMTMSACVSTNSTMLGAATARPATDPASVRIYRQASQVPGRYEEIALLNSSGDANWTNQQKMYESMQRETARLGGNGVILDATTEPGAGARVAAAIFGVSAQRTGRSIAIVVEGEPLVPAPVRR